MNIYPLNDPSNYCAFIGIDWADKKHDICIMVQGTRKMDHRVIEHNPQKIDEWLQSLKKQFNGQRIAVGIEGSKGPLINLLVHYPFLTLFQINPLSLSQYRKSFRVSSAKDDVNDSQLICEMVAKHMDRLRVIKADDEPTRELKILSEQRRKIVQQRVGIVNQLKVHLKQYYPLALEVAGKELYSKMSCEFLLKFSTHEQLSFTSDRGLKMFYQKQGCHSKTIDRKIQSIKEAKPLTVDNILTENMAMTTRLYARMLLEIAASVQEYDDKIQKKLSEHPDGHIFKSLPGAGSIFAARLASVYGSDRDKFPASADVQKFSGVAPITQKSGNTQAILFRFACPKFIRQTFVEFAESSIPYSIWAKAFYTMQKAKGKSYQMALRALAFKWIRIITKCWKDNKPYNEVTYIKSLQKRKSPLLKYLIEAT